MLEDLAADQELGGMAGGVELLDRAHLELDLDAGGPGPLPCLLEHRRKRVTAAYAEPVAGHPDRELALAATHLMSLVDGGALDQLVEVRHEPGDQATGDRVGRPVLVVDVPARLGGGDAHLAIDVSIVSTAIS